MPSDLLYAAFKETLTRQAMWKPGEPVLVAASGGPDSTCLVDLFRRLREEFSFPLALAHLNHALRGRESDGDEKFVGDLAGRLGLPFHSRRLPEGLLAGTGEGLEAAARKARFAFLEETARSIGAARVALGHTRDDQAETFLLRLVRGSGPRGLAGIYPVVEGLFIHPLLGVPRSEIAIYLRTNRLESRTDSSNLDLGRTRNRIRARLLPLIRDEFNPAIDEVLARTAEILREEDAYLGHVSLDLKNRFLRRDGQAWCVSIPALRVLPVALRRRLLRAAYEAASRRTLPSTPEYEWVEAMEGLVAEGRHGAAATLGAGLEARVLYADLALLPAAGGSFPAIEVPLPVPGEASVPGLGLRLRAEQVNASRVGDPRTEASPDRALLDADSLPGPLAVRGRRPGDMFRPLGCPGESKLKSYLIDRKIPRPARDRIPLVTAGSRIAWVVGFQIDDRFKVTAATRRVLILSKEMR